MTETFLYRHYDGKGNLLYVGVSLCSLMRLTKHREASPWYRDVRKVTIQAYPTREEAFEAERTAIYIENPRHNITRHVSRLERIDRKVGSERSLKRLLERVVDFKPVYTKQEVRSMLEVGASALDRMIAAGQIGHMVVPSKTATGKPQIRISGWQVITYLETAHVPPVGI
jgi:hypothetical protein